MTLPRPYPGIARPSVRAESGRLRRGCGGCAADTAEADLRATVDNLSRKVTDISDVVGRYISEADLDRGTRVAHARSMAEQLARIIGGFPTEPGAYPECALIGRRNVNGTESWFCTGVLVHPQVVLTAAHCQDLGINLVALNTLGIQDLQFAELVEVRRVRGNPLWPSTIGNDICVLILRSASTVTPVPIATADEIAAATETTLVGFGNEDRFATSGFGTQREVTVDITNVRRTPSDNLDAAEQALEFESDREFTAGGGGFDSCNGDSGGPAYILTAGGRRVAGLTSRATEGFTTPCGDGGIYTRVDTQRAFIEQVMQDFGVRYL